MAGLMSANGAMRAAPKMPIRTGAPRPDTHPMLTVDPGHSERQAGLATAPDLRAPQAARLVRPRTPPHSLTKQYIR